MALIRGVTKDELVMQKSIIISFLKQYYKYKSGRKGDDMAVGFAPRKQAVVRLDLLYEAIDWEYV